MKRLLQKKLNPKPEIEPEAESREKAVEAEEVPVEEECKGPWKVVKDPSESGSRGENYE